MVDKTRNDAIVKAAKAWSRLPLKDKTEATALRLFAQFNTNNNGNSRNVLNDVDQIDDYFKDVMGMSVIKTGISKQDFIENIDDWAPEFAKYQAPKEEPKKTLITLKRTDIMSLADDLKQKIEPPQGNTAWGDTFAWDEDDDVRGGRTKDMFKKGIINKTNIVELMDTIDLKEFRLSCYFLDSGDESIILTNIKNLIHDRVSYLEQNGVKIEKADKDKIESALKSIKTENGRSELTNFKNSIDTCIDILRNKGVEMQ